MLGSLVMVVVTGKMVVILMAMVRLNVKDCFLW